MICGKSSSMNTVDMTASSNLKHIPEYLPQCRRPAATGCRTFRSEVPRPADRLRRLRARRAQHLPSTVSPVRPAVHAQKCFIIGKIVSETNHTTSRAVPVPKARCGFRGIRPTAPPVRKTAERPPPLKSRALYACVPSQTPLETRESKPQKCRNKRQEHRSDQFYCRENKSAPHRPVCKLNKEFFLMSDPLFPLHGNPPASCFLLITISTGKRFHARRPHIPFQK